MCVCVFVCGATPSDAEANRAHVGQYVVEQVVTSSSGLQVDVELGELQLDIIDVMEEQHQNAYIVVSEGQKCAACILFLLYTRQQINKCLICHATHLFLIIIL